MTLRIAYINHSTAMGGGEMSLLGLLKLLDRGRYSPLVACPEQSPLHDELDRLGVISVAMPISIHSSPLQFASAVRQLRKRAPSIQIVHGNSTRSLRATVLLGRLFNARTIWHVRDRVDLEYLPELEKWFARQVDTVIANSAAVADRLGSLPVRVVHNAVDTEAFNPQRSGRIIREEFGIASHELLVGVVGRISVWKGHETFAMAMQHVARSVPNVRALVVGEQFVRPPDLDQRELQRLRQVLGKSMPIPSRVVFREQELIRLVHDLNLDAHVLFAGFRQDIPDIMAALDLLVLPSWWEPFGRVLIEAMASGTPVVATNVGGPAEIVRHGETGLLVPPLDPRALADAMCEILARPSLALEMSRNGRTDVEERFTIQKYVGTIGDIYDYLAGRG